MANSIQKLTEFVDAVDREAKETYDDTHWLYFKDILSERVIGILSGNINEADYIKKWSEHDTD